MSNRGIGNKTRRRRGSGRRFIQLWTNVKRSAAYHSLSCGARAALFEILDKYTGINNGMIGMGARELADRLDCSKQGAANFLNELDDSGLARPTFLGTWRGKRASEWRLTFYRCDKTGELPVLNWEAHSQSTRLTEPVNDVGHKPALSQRGRTQERNSPMKSKPLSQRSRTHIDIYQRDRDTDAPPSVGLTEHSVSGKPAQNVVAFEARAPRARRRGKKVSEALQIELARIARKMAGEQ
jgi:hypothetical protein